jgi:carbamoyl-phosphate synthase small subunit
MIARLALQDGTLYRGRSFGAPGTFQGEVVFNTSMTGYQEILTDPSYCGQIVTMTYPLIGNYGVNPVDVESERAQVAGFVVREYSRIPSNFRSTLSLGEYLTQNHIPGIEGLDTRALTRRIRLAGAMPGILTTEDMSDEELLRRAAEVPGMAGQNLVGRVTCGEPYDWSEAFPTPFDPPEPAHGERRWRVVAVDYGAKLNILRWLVASGCEVTVVPAGTEAAAILERDPDGVFLSNGPGDPAAVHEAIKMIRGLVGRKPVFGICLGHQLLALALGARTFKLKFGHRGANQPVKDLRTGRVLITSQNHGFAVRAEDLDAKGLVVTQVNLNDDTIEGIQHRELPLFAVQYHPEASPGPHDASYLFPAFAHMMATGEAPPL